MAKSRSSGAGNKAGGSSEGSPKSYGGGMDISMVREKIKTMSRDYDNLSDKQKKELDNLQKIEWDYSVAQQKKYNQEKREATKKRKNERQIETNPINKLQSVRDEIKGIQGELSTMNKTDSSGFLINRPQNRKTFTAKQEKYTKLANRLVSLRNEEKALISKEKK